MGLSNFVKVFLIIGTLRPGLTLANNGEKEFTKCSAEKISNLIIPTLQNISFEIQELRKFQKSVEGILPILLSVLPVLNNMSQHESQQVHASSEQINEFIRNFQVINNPKKNALETSSPKIEASSTSTKEIMKIDGDCPNGEDLDAYVTSPRYVNTKIISSLTGVFALRNIPKERWSPNCARMKCSEFCDKANNCHAFNFYETPRTYACELVPDNLCQNKSRIAFVNWPGGTVWEKKSTGMSQSCVDKKFDPEEDIECEVLRPGCLGTWPNCFDCIQHCDACNKRYSKKYVIFDTKECTIWPESDKPYSIPIHLRCSMSFMYLVDRKLNVSTAEMMVDFHLSFQDMNRLSNLKTHQLIYFWFITTGDRHYWYTYENWTIDADGTLRDMVLYDTSNEASGDIFNLNGTALKPTPFVTVEDDRYGCGSFWLLDPKNATYCPGGKVSMFGKLKLDNKKIVSTGMSSPLSLSTGHTLRSVSILLDIKPDPFVF